MLLLSALQRHRPRNRLFDYDFIDRVPGRSARKKLKCAPVGSGNDRSVAGLFQSEYVPPIQTRALLLPVLSVIVA